MADIRTREPKSSPLAGRPGLDKARDKVADIVGGFTTGQKVTTVLAVVGLLVAGMYFMRWASAPSMAPLFSNLAAEDAAAITEELDAQGISYELSDGGRTIMVPRGEQLDLRLDMSAQGLVGSDTPGYALLDENGITTSEFQMRVDYQRAIEGELARTIGAIEAVDSAQVHLVIPEDDLFVQDNEMASASVLLTTNTALSPMQVQSIVNLVAGSVEGLDPSNVTITDSMGNMLAAPGEDGQSAAAGDMRQYQTNSFEGRLAEDVETMLQEIVGPDNAVVTVTADLNFDRIEQTTETFGGDGAVGEGIPLTSTTTTETYSGTGAAGATGVLGPDGTPITAAGDETDYTLQDGTTQFAVDRSVQEILSAPGSVNRLSVAVLLDANVEGAAAAEVQALVEAAVGFDGARGDIVEVSALPFDSSADEAAEAAAEEAASAASQARMMDLIRTVGAIVIVMLVLFFAWRSAKKSLPAREPKSTPLDLAELTAGSSKDDDEAEGTVEEFDAGLDELQNLLAIDSGPTLSDEVLAMIDAQGDDMAGLLRGWMADR